MANVQKLTLLMLFFVFLFFGFQVFAADCNPDDWNNNDCAVDIYYEDPTGGSDLDKCEWKVGNNAALPDDCSAVTGWISACACSGSSYTCLGLILEIGSGKACSEQGINSCQICSKVTDKAGNVGYSAPKYFNIDFEAPIVSITGNPSSWQNTDATANLSCADPYSGCDNATYKLKTYTSSPGACSTNYTDYTLASPQTISFHLWVCGTAKDNADNTGFSTSVEFRIDKEKPVSIITNPEAGSTQTADFNVTVSDIDTGGSGVNTGACYYRTYDSGAGEGWTRDWTLRTCSSTQQITVGAGGDCRTDSENCTVYVYSYDNAGNISDINPRSFLISIDLISPTITVNTLSGQWYNSNPLLDVDFSDNKALDDGFYQVDSYSGGWTAVFTDNPGAGYTADFKIADVVWNGFADGSSHTIYFKATDDAGNVTGADGSKSLVIKKNAKPTCIGLSGSPFSGYSPLSVIFTGSGNDDDGSIVNYQWDFDGDGTWDQTTGVNSTGYIYTTPAAYCAKLRVQDDRGFWSDTPGSCPDTCAFTITILGDTTPPTTAVSPNGKDWGNSDVSFTLTCDDGTGSGCQTTYYKIIDVAANEAFTCDQNDTSGFTSGTPPITSSITCPVNEVCKKKVCYYSVDNTVNREFTQTSNIFKIDKLGPTVGAISPTACQVNVSTDFFADVSDNIEVINCWLYINGGNDGGMFFSQSPCFDCVASKNHTFTLTGEYLLYAFCLDEAGNPAVGLPATVTVTEFAPLSCSVNVPSSGLVNQSISINVSGSQGAITGVRFSSDNSINGTVNGSWDPVSPDYYNWNMSSGNWNATQKTMNWSFANSGNYEVWAEIKNGGDDTRSCYDTILITECYPGQTKNCTSPQNCSHVITCQPDGTWPSSCPSDACTADTSDSPNCPCSGVDGCVGNDYYDYPVYGNCTSSCSCDIGIIPGAPCVPTIYTYDSRCVGVDQCNSDAECDDGNPCTQNICNNPGATDSFCSYLNEPEGTFCEICKKCDGYGNCINQSLGYNECGAGCQRCIYGSCGDYSQACSDPPGNDKASCECHSDICRDCSDYYGEVCGYQGICHCGPSEKPVWSCSNWQCVCACQEDPACDWEPNENPEVIIVPPSQEGDAGDEITYEVTIINPSDEEETYTLIPSVPSGWDYEIEETTVTVPPGGSVTFEFRVTPPEGTSSGEYDISVGAQDIDEPQYFGEGSAKYEVLNNPPNEPEDLSASVTGQCFATYPPVYLSWTFSDLDIPSGDYQSAFHVQIDNNSSFSSIENDSGKVISGSPTYSPKGGLDYDSIYYWRVKVWDSEDDSSNNWAEGSFQTASQYPWPDFSWTPQTPSAGEVVQFCSVREGTCLDMPEEKQTIYDISAGEATWTWDFGDGIGSNLRNPSHTYTSPSSSPEGYEVTLEVIDGADNSCETFYNISVTLPLPEWKEIPPR